MAKKTAALTPPSVQSLELVLQAADNCPRPNGPASRQLDAAMQEMANFFRQLLAPQINASAAAEGAASTSIPQASASSGGN